MQTATAPEGERRVERRPRRGPPAPGDGSAPAARRLTSEDVARAAGVSASAVSRAFTPGASVAPGTRAAILRAARELGYRPNVMARAVATRRSNVVGLILFSETNRHYPEVLLALSRAFSALGMRVMLFPIEEDGEIGGVVDHVLSYQLDGVIAAAAIPREHRVQFERAHVPLLFYNRSEEDVPSVSCDHRASGVLIARHVLAGGHRRFALIRVQPDSYVGAERMRGVEEELARSSAEVVADFTGDFDYEHGLAAVRDWYARGLTDFSAVIAANDVMAIGAKDALIIDYGRHVPDDMVVAGFDGIEAGRWLSHAIASVGQPIDRMAQAAAEMMAERIGSAATSAEHRLFPGRLQDGSVGNR